MKVYNKDKTEILTDYDLTKGYLTEDTIIRHIQAVKGVEKQFHYEVIKEYPNGGKDVKEVVDVEEVLPIEEHDETENILVYNPYTDKELERINAEKRILELKKLLKDSDYKAIKYAEGLITKTEYAPIKAERQAWRDEINELESQITEG